MQSTHIVTIFAHVFGFMLNCKWLQQEETLAVVVALLVGVVVEVVVVEEHLRVETSVVSTKVPQSQEPKNELGDSIQEIVEERDSGERGTTPPTLE